MVRLESGSWEEAYEAYQETLICFAGRKNSQSLLALEKWKNDVTKIQSKSDLVDLMRWKLSFGTFRPGLLKKIEENDEDTIIYCLKNAASSLNKEERSWNDVQVAIKCLINIRGVGPATGKSLLLTLH